MNFTLMVELWQVILLRWLCMKQGQCILVCHWNLWSLSEQEVKKSPLYITSYFSNCLLLLLLTFRCHFYSCNSIHWSKSPSAYWMGWRRWTNLGFCNRRGTSAPHPRGMLEMHLHISINFIIQSIKLVYDLLLSRMSSGKKGLHSILERKCHPQSTFGSIP